MRDCSRPTTHEIPDSPPITDISALNGNRAQSQPFDARHRDLIEVPVIAGMAGKVTEIGLFFCQLETFDGLLLFVPARCSASSSRTPEAHLRHSARICTADGDQCRPTPIPRV